jgi:hypothetical protein
MRHLAFIFGLVALAAGCGNGHDVAAPAADAAVTPAATGTNAAPRNESRAAAGNALPGRTGELVNPDDATLVFLYYDLAGIAAPVDAWVENDTRVKYASAPDKAAQRALVRAELESAPAGVHNVGTLRLTMNADLSDYDPTYGEFTVRALAPSSTVMFQALQQKVSLRFGNGATAQTWQVPADQAQVVRDKLGYGSASIDVLLRIAGVQPAPGGGTIVTDVVSYELRETRTGVTLGRVQVQR